MMLEKIYIVIFLIIGIGILIVGIWNLNSLRHLKNNRNLSDVQLNDPKYYELKYKLEFLRALGSIIIAVFVFLGYTSFQTIKDNLKKDYEDKIAETTKNYNSQIEEVQQKLNNISSDINKNVDAVLVNKRDLDMIRKRLSSSNESVNSFQNALDQLNTKLSEVNSKDILHQRLYLVKDLVYTFKDYWEAKTFEFKNLKTVNGENLPSFKEPPIIIPFTNTGLIFTARNITASSFEIIASGNTTGDDGNNSKFSILISVIE